MDGLRRIPATDIDAVAGDPELEALIRAEIAADGPITFARFMELALYHPELGYYRAASARPGREGDFLTAPEAHPILGRALARLAADVWSALGRPSAVQTSVARRAIAPPKIGWASGAVRKSPSRPGRAAAAR